MQGEGQGLGCYPNVHADQRIMDQRSQQLLSRINNRIPSGVDWKSGALKYLDQLFVGDERDSMRRFHLIKPFTTLQDSDDPIREQTQELCRELGFFAHLLSSLELPPSASFLDVACGTGWVSHYLAKLGLRVCGFDISQSMIDLAHERMRADPWPTTTGSSLNVDLFVHDIESGPLERSELFDVAVLESALHHFVNPINALSHIKRSLKPDGLVVIIEGSSDGVDRYCREIMERYNTLERPFTPAELEEIIACAGYPVQRRMVPLSGFFAPGRLSAASVDTLLCTDRSWNTIVAFNSQQALSRLRLQGEAEPPNFLVNASGEYVCDLKREHWIGSSTRIVCSEPGSDSIGLIFRSPLPNIRNNPIRLLIKDLVIGELLDPYMVLPRADGDAEIKIRLLLHEGHGEFELVASDVFNPSWHAKTDDQRLLSGRICLTPADEVDPSSESVSASQRVIDVWMGPHETFQPIVVEGNTEVRLKFTSPIPRQRLRTQQIWVRVKGTGQVHRLQLRPSWAHEVSAVLELTGLVPDEELEIQSSDCFSPAWQGQNDTRLLSYRITQEA